MTQSIFYVFRFRQKIEEMSTYLHLSNFDIVTEVYKRQQEAELFREKEFRAALRVQVHYSTVNASF